MRSKLSAIIIDPNYYQHEYLDLKSPDYGDCAEKYFEVKILDSDKNILEKIYDFNYFDALISIGDINQYTELFKLPFEYRKKWCHYDDFNIEKINNSIISTFEYNIDRDDTPTTFSFFTCTYNTPKDKLKRLYNSFISQTYKEWNWFIIDDSPNDDTINIINSFKDPRITIIKNVTRHGNIGFNKHTVAMMCNGDYLVEIDHDDEITIDCLECLKNAFEKYPDAGFAYSQCLEYSVKKDSLIPIIYGEGWGWGEGSFKTETVKGRTVRFSSTPNINPYTIRTIYAQPNHIRCWKKELYHQICGHNTDLSVLDDMELLIRTFLATKMIKIDKVLYIQYEDSGERGSKENNNTQSARFSEIQRTTWILKNKYDKQIHNKIIELGFKDDPWDEHQQYSILWKKHTPNQEIMNYIYVPE
jgi:glycosyltransferase involved in cell wall biosynthesis